MPTPTVDPDVTNNNLLFTEEQKVIDIQTFISEIQSKSAKYEEEEKKLILLQK